MKKMLMAVLVFIAVSLVSTVAYAADAATKISLDDRARFSVSLQSNSLVFSNETTQKYYTHLTKGMRENLLNPINPN